jgi:TetR/AcrR family transcriptional regulator, regulator of cefoperazone and chloramphenicol sensitivity
MPAGPFHTFSQGTPRASAAEGTPQGVPQVATQDKLLLAAGEVFAERGFKDATVREICERADANIAAVSYHFGDKAGLYAAVLEYAYTLASERAPVEAFFAQARTPEERLAALVDLMFTRIVDEGRPSWHGVLMAREMVEPTPALDRVVAQAIAPMWARVRGIVRDFLGPRATEDDVDMCGNSLIGQILHYKHARPVIARIQPRSVYSREQVGAWTRHVTAFSIAGLRAAQAAIDERPHTAKRVNGAKRQGAST